MSHGDETVGFILEEKPMTELQKRRQVAKGLQEITQKYKLTSRQSKFIETFVRTGGDRAESLRIAGYNVKNRNSGNVLASNILKNPKIQNALEEYKEVFVGDRRNQIESDVYNILQARANMDVRKFADVLNGTQEEVIEKLKALPDELAPLIDGFELKWYGNSNPKLSVVLKWANREKAIEQLTKLTGLLIEKKEVNHTGNMPTINIAVGVPAKKEARKVN